MSVPTGTYTGFDAIGEREDLADIIYDITPMDTPFMSNIARAKASAVFHEWQTDGLEAASADNANLEGDDASTNTASPTVRLGNYCQILDKVPRVSGTLRAVNTAGRRDEYTYQVAKRGKELKRDLEKTFCSNNAATAGSSGTARKLAGLGAWLWDNQVKKGTSSTTPPVTSGAPTTAPTQGTAGTFTENDLKTLLEAIWNDGGNPDVVMMDSTDKKLASAFGGIATQYRDNQGRGPAVVIGSADIYVSDWGEVQFVANRFQAANNVFVVELDMWEACYLRPIQTNPLAKTGDSDRTQLITEVTLKAKEPKANGKVYKTGA